MKTVLITIFHGAAAKNILRTNVVKNLLEESDVRVVCLTKAPEFVRYYQKEVPHERIIYDSFYRVPGGALESLFSFLKFRLIRTATTELRHRLSYETHGNRFRYVFGKFFNRLIARRTARQFLRFFDYYCIGDPGFGAVLDKYKPDVVVFTLLFDDAEVSLLREAKKRKIATIGFINSWDKLTARCSLRLLPDKLIVFNDIVKQEAVEHADMPSDKIEVCGIPQYDCYITEPAISRGEFCKKTGLDPSRKIILFAPMGPTFSDSDWEMIDMLYDIIEKKRAVGEAQLFVRFQPNDFVDERELRQRPWLKYDLPGIRFGVTRSIDWDMSFDELRHLTDTLAHISLLVSYASSMSVDTAIFDRPVINVNFEIKKSKLAKSPTFYYQTDHYRKALRSGGICLVRSKEELIAAMRMYLADSSTDSAGRKRLVSEQCWRLDGKAGERVARVILKAANGA